jgi:hypothetical protein
LCPQWGNSARAAFCISSLSTQPSIVPSPAPTAQAWLYNALMTEGKGVTVLPRPKS